MSAQDDESFVNNPGKMNMPLHADPLQDVLHSDEALFPDDALSVVSIKLTALERFFALVTRDCNFNDFIKEILNIFASVIKSEAGSILEIDHPHKTLFFRAVMGASSERLVNFNIPLGQGISGHVAESRSPISVDNVPENTIHLKSIAKIAGFEPRNLVAIPIVVRNRVYGVLELLNRVGEKNYTPSDIETLNYLSEHAAKIIEIRMMMAWVKAHGSENAKK